VDRANDPQGRSAKLRNVSPESPHRRPLVVTADPVLLDELLRLCSASGAVPVVAADPAALARGWHAASVVLLDCALAGAARHLGHRSRIVVIGSASDPLWEVAAEVGADHVAVLPSAASWLVGLLSSPADAGEAAAPLVCVMGGQGGGGATSLAIALGRCASARRVSTVLIDGDPFGGGIDLALGMESASGDRWPQVVPDATGGVATGFIHRLPARSGLRILATDRDEPFAISQTAITAVLAEAQSSCELVVADLPRCVDASTGTLLAAASCTYLVLPAQVRAVAAAVQLAALLVERCPDVRAVVRGPAPSGLSLDAVTRSLRIPLAGAIRAEPGIARDYERGVPPGQPRGPLARLCGVLLDQLLDHQSAERSGAAA
jgi:secretion/DNA translocation related CpaE-like protein